MGWSEDAERKLLEQFIEYLSDDLVLTEAERKQAVERFMEKRKIK
jgi:RNA polymerase-interacting CarD/CdnL/TRCF family regulator